MMIKLIAAMDSDGLIGINNTIPWHYPEDFRRFKILTYNGIVIMGRKTVLSLPRKLKNRTVIGIGKGDMSFADIICESFIDALKKAKSLKDKNQDIWIGGGASIYSQALDGLYVDYVDLTIVEKYIIKPTDKDLIYFPKDKLSSYLLIRQDVNKYDDRLKHLIYRLAEENKLYFRKNN